MKIHRAAIFLALIGCALVSTTISFSAAANSSSLVALASGSSSAKAQPVKIITNDWTSQIVLSHIAGELFSKAGYKVEYLPSTVDEQWGALSLGLAHVQVEVWEGTMADMYHRMIREGGIIDAGSHMAKTREEWWYPQYVQKLCAGLPDWRALKRCASLFVGNEEDAVAGGFGVYYSGPWEKPDEARIRALGMQFKVKRLPKGDDLWRELKEAAEHGRPILLFNWTPNWVESVYPGKFVEFPDYEPQCETNPAWGINPKYLYDCGNPKGGWLKKIAWKGMKTIFPCAYTILQNMSFDNAQIAQVSSWVDVDHMSHQLAATRWISENNELWSRWMPDECSL